MDKKLRLSLIFQAAGNATSFLQGMKGETEKAGQALGAARKRVNELKAATRDVASIKRLDTQLGSTRDKLAAAQTEAQRLGRAHAETARPTKALSNALAVARTKVNELKDAEQRQAVALQTVRQRLDAAGVSTKRLSGAEIQLTRDTRRATEEMEKQQKRLEALEGRRRQMAAARRQYDKTQQLASTMQGAGTSSMAAGAVAGAPLVLAAGEAMSFQEAMLDVKKVVDFDSIDQFKEMQRDVLALSDTLPMVPEDIAAIIAAAGQAKVARGELIGFAGDAARMGVAFDTTASDAGEKMATWRTAFGMTQERVRGLADQINWLGDNGNATALKIAGVVTKVGPLGEVAGFAAGEVAALGSAIVGMGADEDVAGTGIKNLMLALTKGSAATKRQQEALKALKLDAVAVSKAMQVDASGTVIDVLERIRKLSEEDQVSVLGSLFGTESVTAIAPILNQLDILRENFRAVGDAGVYSGSMQTEFANRMSGAKSSVDTARNSLKGLAIVAGNDLLPIVKTAAERVGGWAVRMRAFAEANPAVVRTLSVVLAVVAGGLLIFGGLALAIAAVLGPFALLRLTLVQTGLLFGPFARGALLAGKGLLAFGAAAAKAGLMLLANPITWIVLGIVAAVALLAGAAYLIYRNWGQIGPWLGGLWQSVGSMASDAIGFLGRLFMNFSPLGLLLQAFARIWPGLQALAPRFGQMGRDLISGLVNGILGGVPGIIRAVMSAGGSVITAFKTRLGIRSPSRVFAQMGNYTMQGLGVGIARSADNPMARMRRAAAAVAAAGVVTPGALGLTTEASLQPTFTQGLAGMSSAATGAGRGGGAKEVHLHIHAAPGMSADQLVELAMQKLRAELGMSGGEASLGDGSESWGDA